MYVKSLLTYASLFPELLDFHAFELWPVQVESVKYEEERYFPKSISYHHLTEKHLLVHSAAIVELREGHLIVEALRIRLRYAYVVYVVLDFPFELMDRRLLDTSHLYSASMDLVDLTCKKFAIFRRPMKRFFIFLEFV